MDSIELINIIKKMLADNLTTSAREQLLDEKPMINNGRKHQRLTYKIMWFLKTYLIRLWLNAGVKNSLY